MAFKFCPECGTESRVGDGFCGKCGQALEVPRGGAGLRPMGIVVLLLVTFLGAGWWLDSRYGAAVPRALKPGESAPTAAAAPAAEGAPAIAPPAAAPLPEEIRKMLAESQAQAEAAPKDLAKWAQLGRMLYRASKLDPVYTKQAEAAFDHNLEIEPDNVEALRGLGNLAYDRKDRKTAIVFYEKVLAAEPTDPEVRTDLGTMRFESGDADGAIKDFEAVIASKPDSYQAHFNLGIVWDAKGDRKQAIAAIERARESVSDPEVRRRIQTLLDAVNETGGSLAEAATLAAKRLAPAGGAVAPVSAAPAPGAAPVVAAAPAGEESLAQRVERVFRAHPVAGPKIVAVEWPSPTKGRILMANFPMDQMPPVMRDSWLGKMRDAVRAESAAAGVKEVILIEIVDQPSGRVMATVDP